jgi:hypothetical protein
MTRIGRVGATLLGNSPRGSKLSRGRVELAEVELRFADRLVQWSENLGLGDLPPVHNSQELRRQRRSFRRASARANHAMQRVLRSHGVVVAIGETWLERIRRMTGDAFGLLEILSRLEQRARERCFHLGGVGVLRAELGARRNQDAP